MPALDTVPRSAVLGLSAGALGFALGAMLGVVERTVMLLWPPFGVWRSAWPSYSWVVEAAIAATTFLCSWRPVPGTRSHLWARAGAVAWVVALAAEEWPSGSVMSRDACANLEELPSDSPVLVVTLCCARLLLWLSLGGVVLASGRRFALPRWSPAIAAGLGATLAEPGLDEVLRHWRTGSLLIRFPTFTYSLVELVMLVVFAGAFASVASAMRRRPLLDPDALVSTGHPGGGATEIATRTFYHWSASSLVLLVCVFALTNQVGTALARVPLIEGWGSDGRIVFALSLLAVAILVERARRKNPDESSFAPTIAAGVGALWGAASASSASSGRALALRILALGFCGFAVVAVAVLLPKIPGHVRTVRNMKGALALGGVMIASSGLSEWTSAGSRCETPVASLLSVEGHSMLLFGALVVVTLAVHRAVPIEGEILRASSTTRRGDLDERS